jgi:hypothetical protein
MLMARKAFNFIENAPEPSGPDDPWQTYNENLAFAQQILRENSLHLNSVFNMILGELPEAATVAQIFDSTDAQLNNKLTPARLQALARGLRLG